MKKYVLIKNKFKFFLLLLILYPFNSFSLDKNIVIKDVLIDVNVREDAIFEVTQKITISQEGYEKVDFKIPVTLGGTPKSLVFLSFVDVFDIKVFEENKDQELKEITFDDKYIDVYLDKITKEKILIIKYNAYRILKRDLERLRYSLLSWLILKPDIKTFFYSLKNDGVTLNKEYRVVLPQNIKFSLILPKGIIAKPRGGYLYLNGEEYKKIKYSQKRHKISFNLNKIQIGNIYLQIGLLEESCQRKGAHPFCRLFNRSNFISSPSLYPLKGHLYFYLPILSFSVFLLFYLILYLKKAMIYQNIPVKDFLFQNINIFEFGFLLKKSNIQKYCVKLKNKYITSFIFYLDQKKYIRLKIDDSGVILEKIKELPDTVKCYEKDIFNSIFSNGNITSLHDVVYKLPKIKSLEKQIKFGLKDKEIIFEEYFPFWIFVSLSFILESLIRFESIEFWLVNLGLSDFVKWFLIFSNLICFSLLCLYGIYKNKLDIARLNNNFFRDIISFEKYFLKEKKNKSKIFKENETLIPFAIAIGFVKSKNILIVDKQL